MNYYVDRIAHDIRIYSDEGQLLAVVEDGDETAYDDMEDDSALDRAAPSDDADTESAPTTVIPLRRVAR